MGAAALGGAAALQVGSGLYAAKQARVAGEMAQQEQNFLAAQDELNAKLTVAMAEKKARDIAESASFQDKSVRIKLAEALSGQRVALAASGIGGWSVTAEDIGYDSAKAAGLDEAMIRENADRAIRDAHLGGEWDASNLLLSAKTKRQAGESARYAGRMNSNATLLGTAGQVAGTAASAFKYGRGSPTSSAPKDYPGSQK